MREVLTFQFGSYSNYIGTHFWNAQEALTNHDTERVIDPFALFNYCDRGTSGTPMFVPRMLLFDGRSHVGGLYKMYPEITVEEARNFAKNNMWSGGVEMIPSTIHEITHNVDDNDNDNETQEEENEKKSDDVIEEEEEDDDEDDDEDEIIDDVHSWSEYLGVNIDPKCVCEVPFSSGSFSDLSSFALGMCSDVWNESGSFAENVRTRMRLQLEACDSIQGSCWIVDAFDASGGLAKSVLTEWKEETKSPVFCFGSNRFRIIRDYTSVRQKEQFALNRLLAFSELATLPSLYFPFSLADTDHSVHFPRMCMSMEKSHDSSAILAAALDSFLLKYREPQNSKLHLSDVVSSLRCMKSHSIAAPYVAFPLFFEKKESGEEINYDSFDAAPLWPISRSKNNKVWNYMAHVRGVRLDGAAGIPFWLPSSFPSLNNARRNPDVGVPVGVRLEVCTGIGDMLENCVNDAESALRRWKEYVSAYSEMENDEWKEMKETVLSVGSSYFM